MVPVGKSIPAINHSGYIEPSWCRGEYHDSPGLLRISAMNK